MNRFHLSLLKKNAEQAADVCNCPFPRFMNDWGLHDFLIDESDRDDSPREFAARALDQLCSRKLDRQDFVVFLTVIQFLDEIFGKPVEDPEKERRLRDLKELIQEPGTYKAILDWIDTWYGSR